MKRSTSSLTEGPIVTSLITLAIPIMLANLLQAAYHLIDAFWVGRLGEAAVAAVSVTFPVTFFLISLGAGLGVAGSTLIAQYMGARNTEMVNHIAGQTMLMVFVVSLVLGMIGYALAPGILQLMGVDHEVFVHAVGFMRVSFLGLVFTFGFAMFQSLLRGVGQVTIPLYLVGGTVLLNFVMGPLLIFGWGPIPAYGVMGAALVTVFAQGLAMVIGFWILFRGTYGIHLSWNDFVPDMSFMKRVFFLGFPASVEQSARALGLTVLTFLITSFGTLTVASYGVGSNIMQFVYIMSMGWSMAISALVGQNIGAGNIARASDIARVGAWFSFVGLSIVGLCAYVFAPSLIAIFVPNDPAVIAGGAVYVRTIAWTFGFIGIQMSFIGVFRASGNMMTAMLLALISQWVLQFPIAYILSKHTVLGAEGIWWAFPVSNIIMALIVIGIYLKGDWKKVRLTEEEQLVEKVSEEIFIEEITR